MRWGSMLQGALTPGKTRDLHAPACMRHPQASEANMRMMGLWSVMKERKRTPMAWLMGQVQPKLTCTRKAD